MKKLPFYTAAGAVWQLIDDIGGKDVENLIRIVLRMNIEFNRFGEIQTEDSHDGFGVDDIAAGDQIKIIVEFGDLIHKCFYFINRI